MNRARRLLALAAVAATAALAGCGSSPDTPPTPTDPQAQPSVPAQTAPVQAGGLPDGYQAKAARKGATRQVFDPSGQPAITADHKAVLVGRDGKLITPDGKPATIAPPATPKDPAGGPAKGPAGDPAKAPAVAAKAKAPKLTRVSPDAVTKRGMPLIWLGDTFMGAQASVSTFGEDFGGYLVQYATAGSGNSPTAVVVAKLPADAQPSDTGSPVSTALGAGRVIQEKGRPQAFTILTGSGERRYSVTVTVADGVSVPQAAHALTRR